MSIKSFFSSDFLLKRAEIAFVKNDIKDLPHSIILIIADGTGFGQYSLSYYANGPFAPARFEHIGLVATHPADGECSSTCKRVTDSAASGTALSSGIKID